MYRVVLRNHTRAEWTGLTSGFADLNLLQTWAWGEAKALTGPWTVERGLFLEDGNPVGAFQALLRRLPLGLPGGLAWINRGPLWRHAGDLSAARLVPMLESLRRHYCLDRGFYLRVAPTAAEDALADKDLAQAGMTPAGSAGWASAVLDLAPDEPVLRRGLDQKWRNCLNKAEKSGLSVEAGDGEDLFATLLDDYRRFLGARGFATTVGPDLLRIWRGACGSGEAPVALIARTGEGAVAGTVLLARFGERAEYLVGTQSEAGRQAYAGQLLLWRALCEAKRLGARRFDLGGMDPDLTPPGIFRFKAGLKATPYRLAGEVEATGRHLVDRLGAGLVRWRIERARAAQAGAA